MGFVSLSGTRNTPEKSVVDGSAVDRGSGWKVSEGSRGEVGLGVSALDTSVSPTTTLGLVLGGAPRLASVSPTTTLRLALGGAPRLMDLRALGLSR